MCAMSSKDDRLWFGLVAFVVGAVVLLQRFEFVPMETWDYLWPSILVVSGLKWMLSCGGAMSCDMGSCESGCGDCGSMECSCDMPAPKVAPKKTAKKTSKRK